MKTYPSSRATKETFDLAEGVVWDSRTQLVRWVDIRRGRVLAGEYTKSGIEIVGDINVGQSAGAVLLAADGGLLVCGQEGLISISVEGQLSFGPRLISTRNGFRLNDATIDKHGSLIVGTLSLGPETGQEELLRVSPSGDVELLRTGVRLSNGISLSKNGDFIYHIDTFAGTLSKHSYTSEEFASEEPWITVIEHFPAYPDGMTVDSNGDIWVALWGGSSVNKYSPEGELLAVVEVAATQVSCPEFIGPDLDVLAITSATQNLEKISDSSGALFVASVDVKGLPANLWAGSTTEPYWR